MKVSLTAFVFATLLCQNLFASGDGVPKYSGSTSSFRVYVAYAREWEYASGDRNDGPMLFVTPASQIGSNGKLAASLYYVGNSDVLKGYEATLLAAQAQHKPVLIWFGDKWAHYKNALDDAEYPVNGAVTGFKILAIEIAP